MATKRGKILIVDDNPGIRRTLEILLPMHFTEVKTIPSPATLVSSLEQFRPDVVLLDMNFNTSINTGNEGLYWTGEIKKMFPRLEVVLFTAYADIALAVEGMKRGAFDFIVTPSGEYVFLECNPNGQWLWIEMETELKISEAIADALETGEGITVY